MPLALYIPEMPAGDLVRLLADPHRSVHAYARPPGGSIYRRTRPR
jgi:hypothetical protein